MTWMPAGMRGQGQVVGLRGLRHGEAGVIADRFGNFPFLPVKGLRFAAASCRVPLLGWFFMLPGLLQ